MASKSKQSPTKKLKQKTAIASITLNVGGEHEKLQRPPSSTIATKKASQQRTMMIDLQSIVGSNQRKPVVGVITPSKVNKSASVSALSSGKKN